MAHKNVTPSLEDFAEQIPGFLYQLEMSPGGTFRFRYVSSGIERILGVSASAALADAGAVMSLIHAEDIDRVIDESIRTAKEQRAWHGEFRMTSLSGKSMWFEAQDSPMTMPDGTVVWTGYANDVTAKKNLEKTVVELARYDALTKLPNRATFLDIAESVLRLAHRNKRRFALLFVDLDKFKSVNDSLGHGMGDLLLQSAATRMTDAIRGSDVIGRYGGDEFLIVLPNIENAGNAELVARKINTGLGKPFDLPGHEVRIASSIGIALFPEHGAGIDRLIDHADRAMYEAKKSGSGNYRIFSSDGA
jgi:diguanylate cyclase (GGDEF)-like protein/PAS domain S-box-containing protein